MTTRAKNLQKQVEAAVRQAYGQLGSVRGLFDLEGLRRRSNRFLTVVCDQSARLENQEHVPLPSVVKNTLGRVHQFLDSWVEREAAVEATVDNSVCGEKAGTGPAFAAGAPESKKRSSRSRKPSRPRRPRQQSSDDAHD